MLEVEGPPPVSKGVLRTIGECDGAKEGEPLDLSLDEVDAGVAVT